MNIKLQNNGLSLIRLDSRVSTPDKIIQDPVAYIDEHAGFDGFVVAYMDFALWIGRFSNDDGFEFQQGQLEARFLQRIRVFNAQEELLMWRVEEGFKARLRRDDETGEREYAVDAQQVLFGTNATTGDKGFTILEEQRGTIITLPFESLNVDEKKNRVRLKTRNYVQFNPVGQAGYHDCRFMGFTNNGNDLL